MKISFAITTHNEGHYIEHLFQALEKYSKNSALCEFEVVVVDDFSQDSNTDSILQFWEQKGIQVYQRMLNNDFASQKNFLNSKCNGDYIFQLDADEMISEETFHNLVGVLMLNPEIDAFWIPRINTVHGLTESHVIKWGWRLSTLPEIQETEIIDIKSDWYKLLKNRNYIIKETYYSDDANTVTYYKPIIQWPDYQMRLYRNDSKIQWIGKVHEQLSGVDKFSILPAETHFSIHHHKMIDRQEKQNELYATIQRENT